METEKIEFIYFLLAFPVISFSVENKYRFVTQSPTLNYITTVKNILSEFKKNTQNMLVALFSFISFEIRTET